MTAARHLFLMMPGCLGLLLLAAKIAALLYKSGMNKDQIQGEVQMLNKWIGAQWSQISEFKWFHFFSVISVLI